MFAIDWTAAEAYATVGEFVIGFLTFIVLVYAGWHGVPRMFNHGRVLYERNLYRDEAKMLRDLVEPMRGAAELLASLDGRVADMERVQIISVRYIVELLVFINSDLPPAAIPPMPIELRDEVLEGLKERQQHRAEAAATRDAANLIPPSAGVSV